MSNEDRGSFEEQWQQAFENAEMEPPAHIWAGIDSELANIQANNLSKKIVFYRYVAAAAIIIALSLSVFVVVDYSDQDNVVSQNVIETESPDFTQPQTTKPVGKRISSGNSNTSLAPASANAGSEQNVLMVDNDETNTVSVAQNTQNNLSSDPTMFADSNQTPIAHNRDQNESTAIVHSTNILPEDANANNDYDAVAVDRNLVFDELKGREFNEMLAVNESEVYFDKVPVFHFMNASKESTLNDPFASVEFTGGTFDPNFSQSPAGGAVQENTAPLFSLADTEALPKNEDMTAGASYVVGFNYGTKVANKVFLQSGLQYGLYEANTTTNIVFEDNGTNIPFTEQSLNKQKVKEIVENEDSQRRFSNEELQNTFNFASVPVKAGYILLDKKFNIMINGGVVTNFYLGNEIVDPDQEIETIKLSPGSKSSYRTVSFNAITGMSIGYNFLDNYALTIVPSYQRSINSLTKSSSNFSVNPEGFGMTVGVRYIFN